MDANLQPQHDTILTITLPSVGTAGTIVAQRGDLAQIIEFPYRGRTAIETAIDCVLVALEQVQLNPPPVFPDAAPEVKAPASEKPKKTPAKKEPKSKVKPKLDDAPKTVPAPKAEKAKPAPVTETPIEPAKNIEQLSLF